MICLKFNNPMGVGRAAPIIRGWYTSVRLIWKCTQISNYYKLYFEWVTSLKEIFCTSPSNRLGIVHTLVKNHINYLVAKLKICPPYIRDSIGAWKIRTWLWSTRGAMWPEHKADWTSHLPSLMRHQVVVEVSCWIWVQQSPNILYSHAYDHMFCSSNI